MDPDDGKAVSTAPFTYTVADDIGGDVLVLAVEDYTGASPAQKGKGPRYADEHVAADVEHRCTHGTDPSLRPGPAAFRLLPLGAS